MSRREIFTASEKAPAELVAAAVPALAEVEPVALDLIEAYKTWLDFEQRWLLWQMADDPRVLARYAPALHGLAGAEHRMARARKIGGCLVFIGNSGDASADAYSRAADVMREVGCDWREDGDSAIAPVVVETTPLAVGHPDETLLALREPYERAYAKAEAIAPEQTRAEEAYFAARAADPEKGERALRRESGLSRISRRWEKAVEANYVLGQQIAGTPARTLDGAIFKAQACQRMGLDLELAKSLVADLIAMAPA